jgi:hypothetical protein
VFNQHLEVAPLEKGERVIYEGEEAKVICVTPLIVIKTRHRVVCGALQKQLFMQRVHI